MKAGGKNDSRIDGPQPYEDRRHAGALLARRLEHFVGRSDAVVLALPRGGVLVAHEVARALGAPLNVFLVRKRAPSHCEPAMGAIASGGVRILNDGVITSYRTPEAAIDAVAREEQIELERRERIRRDGRALSSSAARTVRPESGSTACAATLPRTELSALRDVLSD